MEMEVRWWGPRAAWPAAWERRSGEIAVPDFRARRGGGRPELLAGNELEVGKSIEGRGGECTAWWK